ncbi:MAG: ABC transporter ATP-binding protein [Deltaproteobacteria bacterium]|nr:ABC transporter ATP-binding protein [Deltaproteobacteria bacterium]
MCFRTNVPPHNVPPHIYLNGAILGMRKGEIERKFEEIVAFAEVEKFIDTPVKYFSSNTYVPLAFAVAARRSTWLAAKSGTRDLSRASKDA